MIRVKELKNTEHIRDIVFRTMKKLKESRRIVIRCQICNNISLANPNSEKHKLGVCGTCLDTYGHVYREDSNHEA